MTRRVLIFSLFYYPQFVSGAEAAVKEITDRIDPKEIEFHLVTLRSDHALACEEQIGNVHVHRIGLTKQHPTVADLGAFPLSWNKLLFQILAAYKAWSLHRRERFDATWSIMAQATGIPAVLFKMMYSSVPLILTLQEGNSIKEIERSMRPAWPLFVRAFRYADVIQPISTTLAAWARALGAQCPIEIIPNGANPRDLSEDVSPVDVEHVRLTHQKQPDTIWLINTARLVHQKGHDTVIRALLLLASSVKYLMVGDGPDQQALAKLAQDIGVSDRVLFVGRVDRSHVTAYRRAADIFVGPSRSEGLGNAFLSAMASRLPVIATRAGGLADFIWDRRSHPDREPTAWVVDADAPEQIAQAVQAILTDPENTERVVKQARNMVEREYDWNVMAHCMVERVFSPLWSKIS